MAAKALRELTLAAPAVPDERRLCPNQGLSRDPHHMGDLGCYHTAGHRASISVRYRGGSTISSFDSSRGSIRPRYRAFENRGPILGKARYRGQRTKCGSYQKLMTGRSRSCLSSCWQTDSLATYERCKIRVGYALEDRRWIRIGYTLDTHWICVGYALDTRWIRVGYALDALAHTSV